MRYSTRVSRYTSRACIVHRLGKLNIVSCITKRGKKNSISPFFILPTFPTTTTPNHCPTNIAEVWLVSDPYQFQLTTIRCQPTSAILVWLPCALFALVYHVSTRVSQYFWRIDSCIDSARNFRYRTTLLFLLSLLYQWLSTSSSFSPPPREREKERKRERERERPRAKQEGLSFSFSFHLRRIPGNANSLFLADGQKDM